MPRGELVAAALAAASVDHLTSNVGVRTHPVPALPHGLRSAAAGNVVLYLDTLDARERRCAILHGLACLAFARVEAFALEDVDALARKLADLLAP